MRERLAPMKGKRQIESILLVCVLVATGMVVVFPLTAPKAKAYDHLGSAAVEDGDLTYDADGARNNVVVWHDPGGSGEDHIISTNYIVESDYTLKIPALDFTWDPITESVVSFTSSSGRINVYGTLIINTDWAGPGLDSTKTAFVGESNVWSGIYFYSGSKGRVLDTQIRGAKDGIVFKPGSYLLSSIRNSIFDKIGGCGLKIDCGIASVENCIFKEPSTNGSTGLYVSSGDYNVKYCEFYAHGKNEFCLQISDANTYVYQCKFNGDFVPGNEVRIKGNSDGTVLEQCWFEYGVLGDHFIKVDGTSPLILNCSFSTKFGELSVIANEEISDMNPNGIPAHPIILNPTAGIKAGFWDDSFDNATINATGNSSVTLQWYLNVFVQDPDGNPIENAPVWVSAPSEPSSEITDENGWARGFIITELIQYNASLTNFNPFDISALNNSITGYANPTMNMSKEIGIIVPFNPVPNTPPIVSWISKPVGVQTGCITIDFLLEDPNPSDNGNMSIFVEYSTDGSSWHRATAGPGSNIKYLLNNTLYHFVWDSSNPQDLKDIYNTTVCIRITPSDRAGPGTPNQTGTFTVDNEPPILLSGPFVTATNTTAIINWTVHEPANASVRYGLDGSLTNQEIGSTGTTNQTVALSGLLPGRKYSYVIYSIDPYGNEFSSITDIFDTEVRIHLYKGWNMISIPPHPPNPDLETVLAPIAGQYDAVQWYDPTDPVDPWKHYKVGKPYGNDLLFILPMWGYWIYMKNDTIFIPDQDVPDLGYFEYVPLMGGEWSLIGYPSVTTRNVTTALNGVPYDMVQTYDAATGQWLSYDPNTGSGDLTEMELGRGYWLHATANHNWTVSYV